MSYTLPTVLVKGEDGNELIVNQTTYDENPGKYELFVQSSFDKKGITAFLNAKGVKYAKNASEEKLTKLYEETKNTLSVVEKDDQFVIVNGLDEQIGEESYATLEDADVMLKLLTGN